MTIKKLKPIMKRLLIALSFLLCHLSLCNAGTPEIGFWQQDSEGLPSFVFTGKLPSVGIMPNGEKAKLPEDPWFLLGNYRLTLFAHTSGVYELISGEREWGRLNQGSQINYGVNAASVEINGGEAIPLVGMGTVGARQQTTKQFGCGYARYGYSLKGLKVERQLRVAPSTHYDNGVSAFLLTVTLHNTSSKPMQVKYTESVLARYVPIMYQRGGCPLTYTNSYATDTQNAIVRCDTKASAADPMLIRGREKMSMTDGFPPSLFIKSLSGAEISVNDNNLTAASTLSLKGNETKTLSFVIGYTFNPTSADINRIADALVHATSWKTVLPKLDGELSREMTWHAYTLEAMATYSQYYKETKIPQGIVYDYYWGQHASARDNYQHAMPLIYYNPELCKSVMRYMAKRTTPWGELRLIEYGYGYADNMVYCTSDQQLFFFQLLAEYLRVTKDYAFLDEKVEFFPGDGSCKATMLDVAEACFRYLRDNVSVGSHGLVRLLNSDWNDNVFVMNSAAYNNVIFSGESLMNTTMAIAIMQNLIPSIRQAGHKDLAESMRQYESRVKAAFLKDLGDRTFPRRMYFDGKAIGEDDMWLEPMGYMLQIQDMPLERKQRLYSEMKKRVYDGEKLGARQQEEARQEVYGLEKGSRENGGFWYSLNGPVIVGMNTIDKTEAWRLLKMMTMENMSHQFPHYWTSYWSASDNQESSKMGPLEGLADQSLDYWYIPVYCGHPHAWLLYCYYRLNEK